VNLILPFLLIRAKYAEWALRYVPPLIDGKFNPDYQQLSDYVNDERLRDFLAKRPK